MYNHSYIWIYIHTTICLQISQISVMRGRGISQNFNDLKRREFWKFTRWQFAPKLFSGQTIIVQTIRLANHSRANSSHTNYFCCWPYKHCRQDSLILNRLHIYFYVSSRLYHSRLKKSTKNFLVTYVITYLLKCQTLFYDFYYKIISLFFAPLCLDCINLSNYTREP